jgi:hypothetical protein
MNFNTLKELFSIKMYSENCLLCKKSVNGSRRKFCSDMCSQRYATYIINKIPKERWKMPTEEERTKYAELQKVRKRNYRIKKKLDMCELCTEIKAQHRHHEGEIIICCCRKCHGIIHKYLNQINYRRLKK